MSFFSTSPTVVYPALSCTDITSMNLKFIVLGKDRAQHYFSYSVMIILYAIYWAPACQFLLFTANPW